MTHEHLAFIGLSLILLAFIVIAHVQTVTLWRDRQWTAAIVSTVVAAGVDCLAVAALIGLGVL